MSGGVAVIPLPRQKERPKEPEPKEESKGDSFPQSGLNPKLKRKSRKELLDMLRKELDETEA